MAMQGTTGEGSRSEINVTPLIDVLLVLLIIFMVIVPLTPRGLETAVPQPSRDRSAPASVPVLLELLAARSGATEAGYRVDGQTVDASALGETLRSRFATRQQPAVMVAADRSLSYGDVAGAIAVARTAGASTIGIATPADLRAAR